MCIYVDYIHDKVVSLCVCMLAYIYIYAQGSYGHLMGTVDHNRIHNAQFNSNILWSCHGVVTNYGTSKMAMVKGWRHQHHQNERVKPPVML